MYYVSFYHKLPAKTKDEAIRLAIRLLDDENYGEIEVPIYDKKSAPYGHFISIAGFQGDSNRLYYLDMKTKIEYNLNRKGQLSRKSSGRR